MNCAQLESALRDLSSSCGYTLYTLPSGRISEVKSLPAVVLEPPTVASVDGRGHGRISYNVTLHILCPATKLTASQRAECMDKMESDILEIFTRLSDAERVISVEELGITPREYAFTSHGEISQTARTRIVTCF